MDILLSRCELRTSGRASYRGNERTKNVGLTFDTRADEVAKAVDAQASVTAGRTRAFVDVDLTPVAGERRRAQAGFAAIFGIDDARAVVQALALAQI